MYIVTIADAPAITAGRANTRTSKSGYRRLSSTLTNRNPPTIPTAPVVRTSGLVQPRSTPSIRVKTIDASATMDSATPTRSIGGAPGRVDSGSQRSPSGTAAMANGTLTRNTDCQPTLGTRMPPSTGPAERPMPATEAHTASAPGRSAGGNITAISDRAGGSTQAAEAPISTRAAISSPGVWARAASTDVIAKPVKPARKTRRRPK
jgi:hypothetical protein